MTIALACVACAACAREPLEATCPDVASGDLVVTEIRGPAESAPGGEWIEVYNASGRTIDFYGVTLALERLDGSGRVELIVRQPGVTVDAQGYGVLGRSLPGEEPDHIDYGYARDHDSPLYGTAGLTVEACGEVVDQVVYRELPATGTLTLDGDTGPDAAANDDDALWCSDSETQAESGIAGTPGQPNRACPE